MIADYAPLRALFADAGYAFVEPPILHDARIFVELAGEELRRRLFLAMAADGTELALRPDYTIPVCLAHLAGGRAKRRADYAYLGPVFRQRRDESGEFLQAGVESLGRTDRAAADADMLRLALAAVDLLGVKKPAVRIGDSALFAAVLDALDLSLPWRKRLARSFGDSARLQVLLKRLAGQETAEQEVPAGLEGARRSDVRRSVEERLAYAGIGMAGGRTAEEITGRFLEKVALEAATHGGPRVPKAIARYLSITGDPAKAVKALRAFARTEKLDSGKAVDQFETRAAGFAKRGVDLSRLSFAADFGRRLDYYTGFVFEIHAPGETRGQIVGGGRYDRLVSLIGAGESVPAIGFSIWLDRIGQAK